MKFDIKDAMASALRLTQANRLLEATAEIQQAWTGKRAKPDEARLRHPLGEAVKALRGLRQRAPEQRNGNAAKSPGPRKSPGGAEFLTKQFACHAGKRDYKLYVPAQPAGGRRPLLIMLHGCTQNADDFAAGTRMNELVHSHGMIVAYPVQSGAANASVCWNWFDPSHQQRDAGEPAIIAGITEEIVASHKVDPTRVYVAGLSAGGAMAMVMGAVYPELYSAIGVHSGLPYKSANDVMSAFGAMRGDNYAAHRQPQIKTIIFHGDADTTVHPSNAEKIAGMRPDLHPAEQSAGRASMIGGRAFTRTIRRDTGGAPVIENWLINGAGHAWSGGSAAGSYTDPKGPDASAEMLRFFLSEDE